MQTEVGAASPAPGETREKENRETQGSLGSPGGEQSRQSLAPLRILFPWFSSDLEPFGEDWGIFKKQDYRSPLFRGDGRKVSFAANDSRVVFFLEVEASLLVGIHLPPYCPLLPTKEVEADRIKELIQSFIHSV